MVAAAAAAGSAVVGGVMSSNAQEDAANTAANAQTASTAAGIDENRRQFDSIKAMLQPYVDAGNSSLTQQQMLLGVYGPSPQSSQKSAIDALQASPQFTSALQLGENRILQNASATGGLRGGNTQAALAQFSPQLLAQMINDQYARLGGNTSLGQNAAAGVGNAGMQTGQNVSALLQQQGAALAGNALAGGRAQSGMINSITSGIGSYAGMGGFGGSSTPSFAGYQPPTEGWAGSYADSPFMASGL